MVSMGIDCTYLHVERDEVKQKGISAKIKIWEK